MTCLHRFCRALRLVTRVSLVHFVCVDWPESLLSLARLKTSRVFERARNTYGSQGMVLDNQLDLLQVARSDYGRQACGPRA